MDGFRPRRLGVFWILLTLLLATMLPSVPPTSAAPAANTITGMAFRDFNANGARDTLEPGISAITVTAYDANGAVSGTVTTAADGTYTLNAAGSGPYRIEFTLPTSYSYLQPGPVGSASNSTVQFVAGSAANINVGLANPADYCGSAVKIVTSCFSVGDATGSTEAVVYDYDYFANSTVAAPVITKRTDAQSNDTGATYGLAYQRSTKRLYSSAYLRRGASFGATDSTGAIYVIDQFDPTQVTPFIDLNSAAFSSIPSANTGPNPHPRGVVGYNWIADHDAFAAVGKVGMGDLDISDDGQTLYAVNLYQRNLVIMPFGANASAPTAATLLTRAFPIPASCTTNDFRPFALKYSDNYLYAGAVCSAQSTQATANLRAYIFRFDPSTNTFDTAPILTFPLNYPRLFISNGTSGPNGPGAWNPWTDVWNVQNASANSTLVNPQPLLTDIELDEQGFMMLGFRDRFGDQAYEKDDPGPDGGPLFFTRQGGDLLLACDLAGTWTLESNGSCGTRTTGDPNSGAGGANSNSGPGGREFFFDERYSLTDATKNIHRETTLGALALLPGSGDLVATQYDVIEESEAGTAVFANADGSRERVAQIYAPRTRFGKTGGLGDVELICDLAPIEIGNRVWLDANNNGIQDAGETPIAGVTVNLYAPSSPSTPIASATTDANGNYRFSSLTGTTALGVTYNVSQLIPNASYAIRLDRAADYTGAGPLAGLLLAPADNDVTANGDSRDSDAKLPTPGNAIGTANYPTIAFNTGGAGANNHTYDVGFTRVPLSLGNLVWNDVDNNGRKDSSENGIDGVLVNLYLDTDNSGTLTAGDTLVSSQNTSNNGHYLFAGLVPATYLVQLDATNFQGGGPLAGYTSSTGSNGALAGPYEPGASGTTDNDDNGSIVGGGIVSAPVVLAEGTAPTNETDLGVPLGATDSATNANSNLSVDFGVFQPASLGDFVWIDTDKDGVQDAGEAGVNGVFVSLYTPNGADNIPGNADDTLPIATTTTATNGAIQGYYHFANLNPNTPYTIKLDRAADFFGAGPLAGYTLTSRDQGGDDALDSDAALISGVPTISAATAGPGTDTPTFDFGFNTSASLGDYVWLDANNDGVQDASETGINGVTVHVYNGATLVDTQLTTTQGGIAGYYHFANLDPNTIYTVKLDNAADYAPGGPLNGTMLSPQNAGGNDATDSDAALVNGFPTISSAPTAGPGSDTPTYDFGFYKPVASLGDYVWLDANKNGVQDSSEAGINGVTVRLYLGNMLVDTSLTATNGSTTGYYHFANLDPNTVYTVKLDNSADYATGGPLANLRLSPADAGGNDATDSDATLVAGFPTISSAPTGAANTDTPTYDFGFYQPLSLGNLVWNDTNNNGLKDPGETGIDGVRVNLYVDADHSGTLTAGDPLVASQNTSNNGHYLFTELGQNTYLVQIDTGNFTAGKPLQSYTSSIGQYNAVSGPYEPGVNGGVDNDDNGTSSNGGIISGPIALAPGLQPTNEPDTILPNGITDTARDSSSNLTVDFGVFKPASLGDFVWYDTTYNGLQDADEHGVPNITVTLYNSNNTPLATTTTDANGAYLFINLPPGTYSVGFSNLPYGYTFTTPNESGNDAQDSDAALVSGQTGFVTLAAGEHNPTLDAGIVRSATTAITLAQFAATRGLDGVAVRWTTATQLNTFSFNLYRSATGSRADATRVTTPSIAAKGHTTGETNYVWTDLTAQADVHYFYWLQEIEVDGTTHEYGPAGVTTQAATQQVSTVARVFIPLLMR